MANGYYNQIGGLTELAYGDGLLNRWWLVTARGFESLILREHLTKGK